MGSSTKTSSKSRSSEPTVNEQRQTSDLMSRIGRSWLSNHGLWDLSTEEAYLILQAYQLTRESVGKCMNVFIPKTPSFGGCILSLSISPIRTGTLSAHSDVYVDSRTLSKATMKSLLSLVKRLPSTSYFVTSSRVRYPDFYERIVEDDLCSQSTIPQSVASSKKKRKKPAK